MSIGYDKAALVIYDAASPVGRPSGALRDSGEVAGQQPGRILVAGDWHGNLDWALYVVRRVPQLLAGEPTRLILHLGDFGIWPGASGVRYLRALGAALGQAQVQLGFIDGNHEDFDQLDLL